MGLSKVQLKKIAKEHYISDIDNFVSFIERRFPTIYDREYISEWADRWVYGKYDKKKLCNVADKESMRILKSLKKC